MLSPGRVAAQARVANLSIDQGVRGDERLISAIAIVGRGMVVLLVAHLSMTQVFPLYGAVIGALSVLFAGQARSMVRHGPVARVTVPSAEQLAPAIPRGT